ncbi:MAG: 30S ribosomal protein S27e [Candidatus Woesearchaeota archaeon]|jgi:ribosomal protein S27E
MENKFIKIECGSCKKTMTLFERASTKELNCNSCGERVGITTGGKIKLINSKIK